jgi:hypothetical protein
MVCFTLPSLDVVFKLIRDRFPPVKNVRREDVLDKYRFVFRHDRAGRLVDAQEFKRVRLPRARFSAELIEELLSETAETVQLLLDAGAEVHDRDEEGKTALSYAIKSGVYSRNAPAYSAPMTKALLRAGAVLEDSMLEGVEHEEVQQEVRRAYALERRWPLIQLRAYYKLHPEEARAAIEGGAQAEAEAESLKVLAWRSWKKSLLKMARSVIRALRIICFQLSLIPLPSKWFSSKSMSRSRLSAPKVSVNHLVSRSLRLSPMPFVKQSVVNYPEFRFARTTFVYN